MLRMDLPRLYGKDASKVYLRMGSATSHVSAKTYEWLDLNGFRYITKDQWLPNSPEAAPIDFFANGYLKGQLKNRKYRTLRGKLRAAKDEWNKIPIEMFRNSLSSWSKRILAIHKAKGSSMKNNSYGKLYFWLRIKITENVTD